MKKKLFLIAKVIIGILIFLNLIWWLLIYSTGHKIPTETNFEFGRDILVLVILLVITIFLEKKFKK